MSRLCLCGLFGVQIGVPLFGELEVAGADVLFGRGLVDAEDRVVVLGHVHRGAADREQEGVGASARVLAEVPSGEGRGRGVESLVETLYVV